MQCIYGKQNLGFLFPPTRGGPSPGQECQCLCVWVRAEGQRLGSADSLACSCGGSSPSSCAQPHYMRAQVCAFQPCAQRLCCASGELTAPSPLPACLTARPEGCEAQSSAAFGGAFCLVWLLGFFSYFLFCLGFSGGECSEVFSLSSSFLFFQKNTFLECSLFPTHLQVFPDLTPLVLCLFLAAFHLYKLPSDSFVYISFVNQSVREP